MDIGALVKDVVRRAIDADGEPVNSVVVVNTRSGRVVAAGAEQDAPIIRSSRRGARSTSGDAKRNR